MREAINNLYHAMTKNVFRINTRTSYSRWNRFFGVLQGTNHPWKFLNFIENTLVIYMDGSGTVGNVVKMPTGAYTDA